MPSELRWKLAGFWKLAVCAVMICSATASVGAGQAKKTAAKTEENTVEHEIRHQLKVLPYYSVFDYIAFTLDGSKVTLTGYVLRPHLRSDAEHAVASIEGVGTVANLIQALPKSSTDDALRRSVYRAIFEDSELQRYAVSDVPAIHIIVKQGAVTLEGSVENEGDKKLAGARASGVSGVSSVSDNLGVHAKGAPGN